jgi:RNA polymerase sigma-70 factor (ECF subfamily)
VNGQKEYNLNQKSTKQERRQCNSAPSLRMNAGAFLHKLLFTLMETDATLLNAARRMDQDALIEIFDCYASALYNYAFRLCSDPVTADQIVGDVFPKLLDQLSSGNGPTANLRSYLYETTYHRLIDEARYAQRRIPLEVADWLQQGTDPGFLHVEDRIMLEQILHAIQNELTNDQRHVMILRFLEEFSLRETAAIMGITVDHVKVIQNRAIAALRRSLDGKGKKKSVSPSRLRGISRALEAV